MKDRITESLRFIGQIVLRALILVLIYINMHYMRFDEMLAILLAVVWIGIVSAATAFIRKRRTSDKTDRRSHRLGLIITDVIVILFMIIGTECNPYWNGGSGRYGAWDTDSGNIVYTKEQALEDYRFAMKYLNKLHPIAYKSLPNEILAQADLVKKNLESRDAIRGYELARELESIFALIGDGHTIAKENYTDPHYMKYTYEHEKNGETLNGINGVSFAEFLKSNPGLVSYELESYGIQNLRNRAETLEGLNYLGINITEDITYNYMT